MTLTSFDHDQHVINVMAGIAGRLNILYKKST